MLPAMSEQAVQSQPPASPLKIFPVDSAAAIDAVARLAHEIWYEHYVPIIGLAQVDYMVPAFQSPAAIAAQIAGGLQYFLLEDNHDGAGYFAIEPQPAEGRMFLSKFYLRKSARSRGIGRFGMAFIESRCRENSLGTLWLTVNKFNPSLQAYERMGFVRTADVVTDIGGGFVMDDYRMEKVVL